MYHFCNEIKSQHHFLDVMKLLSLEFGYFAHCGSSLTLPTHRYHKNGGFYSVTGELFVIDCQDLGQVGWI
jgi:hypothetical protein